MYYVLLFVIKFKVMLYVMEVTLSGNIGKSFKEFLMKTWKICLPKKLKHAN